MNENAFAPVRRRKTARLMLSGMAATAAILLAAPAHAQLVDISACATITDNSARLECYDSLAGVPHQQSPQSAAAAAPAAMPSPQVAQAASPPASSAPVAYDNPLTAPAGEYQSPAEKAKSRKEKAKAGAREKDEASALQSSLARYQRLSSGKIAVELENGQVWLQTDSKRVRIVEGKTLQVEIEKSSFGGYWMTIESGGAPFRVERIR